MAPRPFSQAWKKEEQRDMGYYLRELSFRLDLEVVEYLCLVYGRSGQHHSFTKIAPKDSVPHVNRRHIQNGFLKGPKTYSVLCKYIPKLTYLKKGYYNIGIEVKEIFAVVK